MSGVTHVVWDWNGTLLDDFHVVVEAASDSCFETLGRPIDADEYRTHFTRPVQLFYERILGRPMGHDEWEAINSCFHASYERLVMSATLASDAIDALRAVVDAGCTQSLLSMWSHQDLVPKVDSLGVSSHFVRIDGLSSLALGQGKYEHLVEHLRVLNDDLDGRISPSTTLVIGDSLDDATAALHAGALCVLVEGGSHHADDLAASGVPVARSLVDAVEVGLALR